MGGILSQHGVPVGDDWGEAFASATADKLDVTAYNGDVLVQFLTPGHAWLPQNGQSVRRGLFRSIPGLSEVFPPGPTAVRFKRAVAGVAATVDFDLYAVDA